MEPNADLGQNLGFFQKYQGPLIVAAIVVLAIIVFAVNRSGDTENQNEQTNEQTNNDTNQNEDQNDTTQNESSDTNTSSEVVGNVTATGTLRVSNNPSRGNLMIQREPVNIYIGTIRDFTPLLDKPVTLQAEGDINNFIFLGFAEGQGTVAGTDTSAMGGGDAIPVRNVRFDGELRTSDNVDRGNYMIVSGKTKVFLKSVRDYSSLLQSQVMLSATGTLDSFTNAVVVQK